MYRYILMWEQRTTDINMGSFLHTIHDQGVSILADAIEYSKINEASYLSADNFNATAPSCIISMSSIGK